MELTNKLAGNVDHFANEQARKYYIISRVTGAARDITTSLISNLHTTLEEIIQALSDRFADP